MKILHINKFFWNKGGSETYFFALTELLENAGHTVVPFSMQHENNLPSSFAKFFVPKINFQSPDHPIKQGVQFLYSKTAKEQLELLMAQEKPDLAHVHNIAHQLTPAILPVLKKHGIPIVQTLHDYQLICPNYKLYTQGSVCERCFKHKYYNAALNSCLNDSKAGGALGAIEMTLHKLVLKSYDAVDVFICPSHFLYERLVAWGIPEKKLHYLPNFIDSTQFQNNLPAQPSKDFYLYAGRLNQEKGIDLFIKAAARLPDIKFVIAGEAETAEQNTAYAQQLKLLKNLEWKGKLAQPEVRQLMAQARALIVPSEWYENAPLNVLEAQAARTWVIASQRGGLPELITPGQNGVLFEAGSLTALVESIERVATWPTTPRKPLAPQFTPAYHLQQLMTIYAGVKKPT